MQKANISRAYARCKSKVIKFGWKASLSLAFAIAIPATVFTAVALSRPLSFDGAMNLQVAQNLAYEGRYARDYVYANSTKEEQENNTRVFPNEVETNGPYTVVAALGIRLLGANQFGYQFANIVFVIGSAIVIWWFFRRWFVLAALVPPIALLLLPRTFATSLAGFGELPALFFVLLAFAFVAHAITLTDKKSILKFISFSLVAAGAAIVTKTYLVGFLPALFAGILVIKYAKRDVTFRSLVLRTPYILVVPIVYEVWHLLSLGSISEYLLWWKAQLRAVLFQSGLRGTSDPALVDNTNNIVEKVARQVEVFTNISTSWIVLVIFCVLLLVVSTVVITLSKSNVKRYLPIKKLVNKDILLLLMLITMFASYFVWWVTLLPEVKSFPRRVFPAMLSLELAVAVLIVIVIQSLFKSTIAKQLQNGVKSVKILKIGQVLVVVLLIIFSAWTIGQLKSVYDRAQNKTTSYLTLDDYNMAANIIKKIPEDYTLYGMNWWSSPVISLMSNRDLRNLDVVDVCKLNPEKDIIVWDKIASGITKSPTPTTQKVEYIPYRDVGAAKLYRLMPKDSYCKP